MSTYSDEPPNDIGHLFLGDGFHPGTIGQALIANWFLDAVNSGFGAEIPLLGGDEIVDIARAVPKPSGASLIGSGVLALFGYGRRQRPIAARDGDSVGASLRARRNLARLARSDRFR